MSDWQPIETAPRDGTPVLVVNDRGMFVASWDEDGPDECLDQFWHVYSGKGWRDLRGALPTHWMLLPETPKRCDADREADIAATALSGEHSPGDAMHDWHCRSVIQHIGCDCGSRSRSCACDACAEFFKGYDTALAQKVQQVTVDVRRLNLEMCASDGHAFSRLATHRCFRCHAEITSSAYAELMQYKSKL